MKPPHLCATQWPVGDRCGGLSPGSVLSLCTLFGSDPCIHTWEQAQELVTALRSRFPELCLPTLPPVPHAGPLGLPLPGSLPWGEWRESRKHQGLPPPSWERSSSRQFPFLRVSGSCQPLFSRHRMPGGWGAGQQGADPVGAQGFCMLSARRPGPHTGAREPLLALCPCRHPLPGLGLP